MKNMYKELLEADDASPRGMATKEMLNVSLEFGYGQERIVHPVFNDNSRYIKKELEWYAKGDFTDLSIVDEAKVWKGHVTNGLLWSNYGGWLWHDFGGAMNQGLVNAVNLARGDKNTRRAVAYIGNNSLVDQKNHDVPCTNMIQFIIRNGQVYTRVWMRSQDAYLGLRNDLTAFWFFARVFSKLVDAKPFMLHIDVGSFHLYENNIPRVKAAVDSDEDIELVPYDYGNLVESTVAKVSKLL